MAIPVSALLTRAGRTLHDEKHVRWTEDELIDWINDGAAEIVIRRPPANVDRSIVALAAGASQTAPDGAIAIVDIVRVVPGGAMSRTTRSELDTTEPEWYDARPSKRPVHFCTDDRTPREFWVYPPAVAGTQVEVLYSIAPDLVSSREDVLALDRTYISPLVSWLLFKAHSKDFEYAQGAVAVTAFQAFNEGIGAQNTTGAAVSVKTEKP